MMAIHSLDNAISHCCYVPKGLRRGIINGFVGPVVGLERKTRGCPHRGHPSSLGRAAMQVATSAKVLLTQFLRHPLQQNLLTMRRRGVNPGYQLERVTMRIGCRGIRKATCAICYGA